MAHKLGLSKKATEVFMYRGYEIKLGLIVHENGKAFFDSVNNVLLKEPVKAT
jgi:hypothetical protein